MRLHEILFWDDQPAEEKRFVRQFHLPQSPLQGDVTNLANASQDAAW
jgi:hypothetical protein